jgi:hypothetical protein
MDRLDDDTFYAESIKADAKALLQTLSNRYQSEFSNGATSCCPPFKSDFTLYLNPSVNLKP